MVLYKNIEDHIYSDKLHKKRTKYGMISVLTTDLVVTLTMLTFLGTKTSYLRRLN